MQFGGAAIVSFEKRGPDFRVEGAHRGRSLTRINRITPKLFPSFKEISLRCKSFIDPFRKPIVLILFAKHPFNPCPDLQTRALRLVHEGIAVITGERNRAEARAKPQ